MTGAKPPRRRSLRRRVTLLMLAVVASVLALDAWQHLSELDARRRALVGRSVELIAEQLATNLAAPVWNLDRAAVGQMLGTAASSEEIAMVALYDTEGAATLQIGAAPAGAALPRSRREILWPYVSPPEALGSVEVVGSHAGIDAARRDAHIFEALHIAAVVLAMLIIARIGMARVFRPLEEITGTLRRLGRSDGREPVPHVGRDDEIGDMARAAVVFRDMADELRGLKDDLEREVAAQTVALRSERDRAEDALAARTQFLATVSHELRTPLNGILGMAAVMERGRLDPAQREHLRVVRSCGATLLSLIDDLLDMTGLECGRMSVSPDWFAPASFLADLERVWQAADWAPGVTLDWQSEVPLPAEIRTDRQRLAQVLANLLENARKFTEAGTVSLRAALSGDAGAARLEICVRDTGIGVGPAVRARLFEPFVQGSDEEGRRRGGLGLGLSISQAILRQLGGRIDVESDPGVGSEFRIVLPVERREIGPQGQLLRGTELLIVAEEGTSAVLFEWLVSREGGIVRKAGGVGAVPDAVAERRPGAVLLDAAAQPEAVAAAIRELRRGDRQLPVVAVVADAQGAAAPDGGAGILLGSGATATLPQSDLLAHLATTLRDALAPAPSGEKRCSGG